MSPATGGAQGGLVPRRWHYCSPWSLVVTIPPLPFGAAITRFEVKVGTGFKKGYVKANCSDKNRKINVAGKFTYTTEPAQTVFSKQRCRVKR